MFVNDPMTAGFKEFNPLMLPRKRLSVSSDAGAGYRVYKNTMEFEVVSATTVSDAIEKSGIQNPYKVQRICANVQTIIDSKELQSLEEARENKVEESAPAQEPVAS